MPISLNKNQNLFLVHVPKTAGTSICKALNLKIDRKQHATWKAVPEGYISFAVVREPVDRFISCVRFARSKRTFWHDSTTHPHRESEMLQDMTIHDILTDLEQINAQRKLKHVGWYAQHLWLFENRIQRVHLILGITNLEQNLNTMLSYCGFPQVQLPEINKSDPLDIELSDQDKKRLRAIYAEDYRLLGKYF